MGFLPTSTHNNRTKHPHCQVFFSQILDVFKKDLNKVDYRLKRVERTMPSFVMIKRVGIPLLPTVLNSLLLR